MGNYKFRISYLMQNSWLYKVKGMRSSTREQIIKRSFESGTKESSSSSPIPRPKLISLPNRPSSYFPSKAQKENPPRKSPNKSPTRAIDNPYPISLSSVSKSDHLHDSSSAVEDIDGTLPFHRLPRILTKPSRKEAESKIEFDGKCAVPKRAQKGLHRIRVKPSSPKVEIKKVHDNANKSRKTVNCKSLLESFVAVKKTSDPEADFRDSMVEMIVENGIWNSKDLEELLAFYLLLNSDEYRDVILEVFEDIWVSLREVLNVHQFKPAVLGYQSQLRSPKPPQRVTRDLSMRSLFIQPLVDTAYDTVSK